MQQVGFFMLEVVFAITQSLTLISILIFFFFSEKKHSLYERQLQESLINLPLVIQKNQLDLVSEHQKAIDKLQEKNFTTYLKHIQQLEKIAIQKPKASFTNQDFEEVMARAAKPIENEIENTPEADEKDLLNRMADFSSVPINRQTKVMFEDDDDLETKVLDNE